jgi:hypothetical protein
MTPETMNLKLADDVAIEQLRLVAQGRDVKQMQYLAYVAREAIVREGEKQKHRSVPKRALMNPEDWAVYKAFLSDGEGSAEMHVTLGLAAEALDADDQEEFLLQLRSLYKSCLAHFIHVRAAVASRRIERENGEKLEAMRAEAERQIAEAQIQKGNRYVDTDDQHSDAADVGDESAAGGN